MLKNLLQSTISKVVLGVVTGAVVATVVTAAVFINHGYRTIAVKALTGITKITNEKKEDFAYEGQHLKSGDDVRVNPSADLTLSLDEDKYVYAEAETHFWLEAAGKKADTRTTIHLDEGSQLFRIDNKLTEGEYFDVETPNSTMSVRGTVFRVSCYRDENGEYITKLEVFEGAVYTEPVKINGEKTGDYKVVEQNQSVMIHADDTDSEFVIDENGNDVLDIDYSDISKGAAMFLGNTIDEGRELCVKKDLLYDYAEVTEHIYTQRAEMVEPTEELEGYYIPVCEICGKEGDKVIIPKVQAESVDEEANFTVSEIETSEEPKVPVKSDSTEKAEEKPAGSDNNKNNKSSDNGSIRPTQTTKTTTNSDPCAKGHDYAVTEQVNATCSSTGYVKKTCKNCGKISTATLVKAEHKFVADSSASSNATCTSEGQNVSVCSACSERKVTNIAALGHDYHTDSSKRVEPTCESEGKEVISCVRCKDEKSTSIAKKDHDYSEVTSKRVEATCLVAGKKVYKCGKCSAEKEESIKALGHDYMRVLEQCVTETCIAAGLDVKKCSRCNDTVRTDIPAKGHSYSRDASYCILPTCELEGREVEVCAYCNDRVITPVEKIPHNTETRYTSNSDGTHDTYEYCLRCKKTVGTPNAESCVYESVSGVETCKYCGYTRPKTATTKLKSGSEINSILNSNSFLNGRRIEKINRASEGPDEGLFEVRNVAEASEEPVYIWVDDRNELNFYSYSDTIEINDARGMFKNLTSLDRVILNELGFDFDNCTDIGNMFEGCTSLNEAVLSYINMPNVANVTYLFKDCTSLHSVYMEHMNLSGATDVSFMFENCSNLWHVTMDYIDFSSATDMTYLFNDRATKNLVSVYMQGAIMTNVTKTTYMFQEASKLEIVDMTGVVMPNVTDTRNMFMNCENLALVDMTKAQLPSGFAFTESTFNGCTSLATLNVPTGTDASNCGVPATCSVNYRFD